MKAIASVGERLQLIKDWQCSGLTVSEWCRRNGIHKNTFCNWIHRSRKQGLLETPAVIPQPIDQDPIKQDINPDKIEMKHFSLPYLESFGEYLEQERLCCSSTINLRMSAIKSFLRYAAVEAPEYSDIIRKSLSLPCRKTDKPVMAFLKKEEYEAMLEICNDGRAVSLRDKMLLMVLYNTGCRVSELINVQVSNVSISHKSGTSSIHFCGKGRKERITPARMALCIFPRYHYTWYFPMNRPTIWTISGGEFCPVAV